MRRGRSRRATSFQRMAAGAGWKGYFRLSVAACPIALYPGTGLVALARAMLTNREHHLAKGREAAGSPASYLER